MQILCDPPSLGAFAEATERGIRIWSYHLGIAIGFGWGFGIARCCYRRPPASSGGPIAANPDRPPSESVQRSPPPV